MAVSRGSTKAVAGGPVQVAGSVAHELTSLHFAAVARRLSEAGRERGLEVPAFRSPPRAPGVRRAIRRESDGTATVSVLLRGRPAEAVVADMIDGMMTAVGLSASEAGAARDDLWSAALDVLRAGGAEAPVAARTAA